MTDREGRPKLADGEHWPEPDRAPWGGVTERGRRLVVAAWEQLLAAPEWRPERDTGPDPCLNDPDPPSDDTP